MTENQMLSRVSSTGIQCCQLFFVPKIVLICYDTVWKFKNFSATQNLREIKFDRFSSSKTAIFGYFDGLEF